MDDGKVNLLHYKPCNTVIYRKNKIDILSHCEYMEMDYVTVKSICQNKLCLYIFLNKLYPVITS